MSVDTCGEINFYSSTIDGLHPWLDGTPKLGWSTSNFVRIPTKMNIYDIRGRENQFSIDKNGFEVQKYEGSIDNVFDDDSQEQDIFYNDIQNFFKKRFGASRIVVISHIFRSRGPTRSADQCDEHHKNPVYYPHVDFDPLSAILKLKEKLGEKEAEKILKSRFQIINIWKPIGPNPIVNIPLTICDYQTLDLNNDIHLSDAIGSISTTSLYVISKNVHNQQKWYYLSSMKSNEMYVFKMYDSYQHLAQFGAHTAFNDLNVSPNTLQQCSLEIRSLVLYD